jgi:hypothetical protein
MQCSSTPGTWIDADKPETQPADEHHQKQKVSTIVTRQIHPPRAGERLEKDLLQHLQVPLTGCNLGAH